MATPSRPVLVGVDAFPASSEAALWAVAEAALRHADMQLVVVNDDPTLEENLRQRLQDVAGRCREHRPQVAISEHLCRGRPAAELIRRSSEAQLLVTGSRGREEPAGWLGSVSTAVATRAYCPVTVVHGPHTEFTSGPIVVGYDDSQHSGTALRFALEAAILHHTDVLAILVLRDIRNEYPWTEQSIIDIDWKRWHDEALAHLGRQLTERTEDYPGVSARAEVRRGYPIEELAEAGSAARMLVVGHRGTGGAPGLLLGSVASGVLHHAPCPVTVVR
ncbi:universal stress protein [Saccharopolyspora phatthalungensis]|uniref:Nucleotide-binding universal stress UspA family protein n=1 Tax=Saccharopolyspora phatthalungensis TaxID=664693 RepID=A0A840Q7V9_9PSEU|nr:universal stress protein [Saccharopolyspora phatthalungensis]MBB5156027.1 nucleotide-binding universal stress UspA family protein [Saccharopolyspora phatthalungensis]